MSYVGTYDNAITYQIGDQVSYLGGYYTAFQITTGNLPSNSAYWTVDSAIPDTPANTLPEKTNPLVIGDMVLLSKDSADGDKVKQVAYELFIGPKGDQGIPGDPGDALFPTAVKTANYTASVNDLVQCDVSTNTFIVTLPTAPADKSIVRVMLADVGIGILEVKAGGSDHFISATGPTSRYIDLRNANMILQYEASSAFWIIQSTASPVNFANNFTGVDASTPLIEADISIDYDTRILTITPPLGYFSILLDGNGRIKRYRKEIVNFDAFTDTSGTWYFYFDINGLPVTTQTKPKIGDFPIIVPIYKLYWNNTLLGVAKAVGEFVEYHKNDIPANTRQWLHLQGSVWSDGLDMVSNVLITGSPNADGSNTAISLTGGSILSDNLLYTVTNGIGGSAWEQDLGEESAGSLDSTNSGLFEIHRQDAGGLQYDLPATRFPFPYSASNIIEYITATGTRTEVTNLYYVVVFVFGAQNPRTGETIENITSTKDFATITDARAYNWIDIQANYPILAEDTEIRPLYRLIYEKKSIYDVATKYAVLRETQDIRQAQVTSTSTASGSLPASSVTVVPAGGITSTNVQSALEELDTEKAAKSNVLELDNTDIFIPSEDYEPATKKYVDDASGGGAITNAGTITISTNVTVVIPHGLGVVPSMITIDWTKESSSNRTGFGYYDGTVNNCVTYDGPTPNFIFDGDAGLGVITAMDDTNFTLVTTLVNATHWAMWQAFI